MGTLTFPLVFLLEYEKYIYNRILLYYDISEKIRSEILGLDDVDDITKFDVLLPFPDDIERTTDRLVEKYVEYLKNIKNSGTRDEIFAILDGLLERVAVYKNTLYDFYRNK
jgi:hypothetical protein